MPFPLAHPAAVLPLRRFCPRHLNFSALLIGSIVPDLAYVLDDLNRFSKTVLWIFGARAQNWEYVRNDWEWSNFSHTITGSLLFDLPAAIVTLIFFYALRSTLVETLPNPHRGRLRAYCVRPRNFILSDAGSLLLGILLHFGWDSFTHESGWFNRNWPIFHHEIPIFRNLHPNVGQALWLFSSIGGMAALLASYIRFVRQTGTPAGQTEQVEAKRYVAWGLVLAAPAFAAVPITLHFIRVEAPDKLPMYVIHVFGEYYLLILACCAGAFGKFAQWTNLFPKE
jgi:hypothetical protein